MGKSYRRHHKRPKRKNTRRRRRGGATEDASSSSNWSSMLSPSMREKLDTHYQKGLALGQQHIDSAKKFSQDMNEQTQDYMKQVSDKSKQYYAQATDKSKEYYGQLSDTGKQYYNQAQPHIARYSSLFTKKPNVDELEHAERQATIGTPAQNDPYNLRQGTLP